jgi:hypothetical protein
MPFGQFIFPLIFAFLFFSSAFSIGFFVFKKIRGNSDPFLFSLAYSILIGYGILGYISVFLSLAGFFNKWLIIGLVFVSIFLGYKNLIFLYRNFKELFFSFKKQIPLDKILLLILLFLIIFTAFAAFMPPFRTDTIYYHLPEAKMISETRIFSSSWDNLVANLWEPWTASLPMLMESIFALATKVSGFSLAHLIHYQFFLALIVAIYSFLRRKFNLTFGLIGGILIFTLFELVVNSTVAYVDAAMVAFDIGALLVFIDWFFENKKSSLILSGLLLGFASAIKYLSFYTILILALLFLFKVIFIDKKKVKEIIKTIFIFVVFWFISAGFWYVKNFIFYLNPVYPFFESQPINLKTVYSLTPLNFIKIPFGFFMEPYYFSVLFGFFSLPFLFLFRKTKWILENKKIIIWLLIYLFSFFAVWFFTGTQVRRYATDGQVVLMILFSIVIGILLLKILEKTKLIWLLICGVALLIPIIFFVSRQENNFLVQTLKLEEGYLSGQKSKYEFYRFQNLGEEFAISDYINNNFSGQKIINNLCPKEGNFFLKKGNVFWPFFRSAAFGSSADLVLEDTKDPWPQIREYLKTFNVNYLLVDWQAKENGYDRRSGSCTPLWDIYQSKWLPVEELIKEHSVLIFSDKEKGLELYKINN